MLCNASPDLRQQIGDNPFLHPREGLRHSPIKAVVLTNADVDHIAGLLNLRESQPLRLYATERVLSVLEANPVFNVLNPAFVSREPMRLDEPLSILCPDGSPAGVVVTPFAVPGKVALWLEDESKGPDFGSVEEDTIALEVRDAAGVTRLFYVPACARMTDALAARLAGAELVLFDGTLWTDDEMIRSGTGVKTGRRMGHMSISGEDGTMAAFAPLGGEAQGLHPPQHHQPGAARRQRGEARGHRAGLGGRLRRDGARRVTAVRIYGQSGSRPYFFATPSTRYVSIGVCATAAIRRCQLRRRTSPGTRQVAITAFHCLSALPSPWNSGLRAS